MILLCLFKPVKQTVDHAVLQAIVSKAAAKQQQKQPQTGGGSDASLPSAANSAAAAQPDAELPLLVPTPEYAQQLPAGDPAGEGNSSELAHPADKSDAAAGTKRDSLAGREDAAAGGGSLNGTAAAAAGPNSGKRGGRPQVPQHTFAVASGLMVLGLWCITRRKRLLLVFRRLRGSPEPARRRVAP